MKTYLDQEELKRLENEADNLRDRLLIRLLCRLGCRVTEALSIQVKDIDVERGMVRIIHLKSRTKLACPRCGARLGKAHSFCPKCGSGVAEVLAREQEHQRMRNIPLDSETLRMLQEYIDRGGPVERNGKYLIFGIGRGQAWRIIKLYAQKAGLGQLVNPETGKVHNISPHRLRDAFAVNAVKHDDSGDGLRMLQEHLGHSSFNTTLRYRKVSGDESRQWYDRLWGKDNSDGA
ncbi:MAG: tyrosine-type recombinase/integrase [Dehalococcoidia bacterium]|nr:tyrosine-type recombinase/integrase [Dehalococcoidia bacterium]